MLAQQPAGGLHGVEVLVSGLRVVEQILGLAGPQQVGAKLRPVELHGHRIAHVGHRREVEQFGGVELVVQPAGVGAAVLVQHAGDRAPLRGLAFRGIAMGRLGDGFGVGLPLAPGHRRDASYGGIDRAGQRHQHEQQLDQPEDHAHTASMPPAGIGMISVM